MDMSQYKDLFVSETREHLQVMNSCIVTLEEEPGNSSAIDSLFRMAHSIKGMAASMGFDAMAELAHKMEDLMDEVRKGSIRFDTEAADLLLEGADLLGAMTDDIDSDNIADRDTSDLMARLVTHASGSPSLPASVSDQSDRPAKPGAISPEEPTDRVMSEAAVATSRSVGSEPVQTVRVRTDILDNLINITGELITDKNRLSILAREASSRTMDETVLALSRHLRQLHDEVLKVRLMPFSAVSERLPRAVRDMAKKAGREVFLKITGREIEMDRGILEELSDPLLHIIRNALDHGIEPPEERLSLGKSPAGTIELAVNRAKDRIVITVTDDGRGMDPTRITTAALGKGLLTVDEARVLTRRQALELICLPGFSTAREVTELSGRGVGMDVVRSALHAIGGNLDIESETGLGSRFIISLPVTISIIQIMLVVCAGITLAIPVTKIHRTADVKRHEITSIGKRKVFRLGDEDIPLVSLNRLLGLSVMPIGTWGFPAVVVEVRNRKVALVVDRFLGQQDVFVKPLGRPLNRLKGIVGGAVLGDGQIICIIDPAELV